MPFQLDHRLANDTYPVQDTPEYLLLMMNERRYPWFIVVPKVPNVTEWHELTRRQQTDIHLFCVKLGESIKQAFSVTKINTAALGNVVSQLHIHVIGRHPEDDAWPNPVWGFAPPAQAMDQATKEHRIESLTRQFNLTQT
ncbi:MAG: HIT family protein [Ketobacter sp.]